MTAESNAARAPGQVTGPHEYAAAGFRILPIANDGSKRPLVEGFGKDAPDFTIPPDQFRADDAVAILTGPCPGLGADWLLVLDLDGDTTLDQVNDYVGGDPLPETLSSKNYSHFYFRVQDSDLRAAIRQWVRVFGRGDGAPEADVKWAGGYAIEPAGAWDEDGFDPGAIAVLPESWLRRVLELRNANPYAAASAPQAAPGGQVERQPMGDVPAALVRELGAVWPQPGQGCHEAALALGGILADSWWNEEDIARFACAVFVASGTKNRVPDVLHSVATKRAGGECKGWPSLKSCLKDAARGDYNAALKALKNGVPGLSAPKINVPVLTEAGKVAVAGAKAQLQLNIGSDDEMATCVIRDHLSEAVYDEGAIWNFDGATGTWAKVDDHVTSKWIEVYDGVVYDFTDKGRPIWVKLGSGRVTSIQRRIEAKRAQPGFFASAPTGLAFQNGFLRLDSDGRRTFEALSPEHKARHLLPCAYEPDAARRAPPRTWVRYLKSIWDNDVQAIELVHQILGYLLSGRHDLQKIFVLLGPPRAGKGTLLGVIQSIFRDQATSFKVAALDQTFSMQSMLGKTVAYDPDVRRANSMFKSEGQMVERLLSISAHDVQVIPRKNLTDVVVALPARLLLAANPPFGLTDVGGALASRFVILTFPKSFLGSEDTGLAAALEAEIPAIVALALDGLDRLNAVGRFVEPASSAAERESVERAQNPMLAFLDDECEVGPNFSVGSQELWLAAIKWRDENGHKRMSNGAFGEFLRQRGIHQVRKGIDGERTRLYAGVRLRGQPNVKPYVVADPSRPIGSRKP